MNLNKLLHPQKLQSYQDYLQSQGYSTASLNRKQTSLNQFSSWAKDRGYIQLGPDQSSAQNVPTLPSIPDPNQPVTESGQTFISSNTKIPFYKKVSRKTAIIGGSGLIGVIAIVVFLLRLNLPGALNIGGSAREGTDTTAQDPTSPIIAAPSWIKGTAGSPEFGRATSKSKPESPQLHL